MNTTTNTSHATSSRPAPQHGDRAADLIFDIEVCPVAGGAWVYPACYDDLHLARRRAHSLEHGFGIPFTVDLLGVTGEPWSVASRSVAVSMPGYYAFTTHDPRPHVVLLPVIAPSGAPSGAEGGQ